MPSGILVIRLGAMGDIIHALPAVAGLRKSFPDRKIEWAVAPKWIPLLENNPHIDKLIPFHRESAVDLFRSYRTFRVLAPDVAIDFQGLLQSALLGRASRPHIFWGWDKNVARERVAALFYTKTCVPAANHVVDKNIELTQAAGSTAIVHEFAIPEGRPEGALPDGPFVLANPFAGWAGKQWPLANYEALAQRLRKDGIVLVANASAQNSLQLEATPTVVRHLSSLYGLIDATRRAAAVVGVDSGPLHLAAALQKPGVGLYGPTDPARNGPYGGLIRVLRSETAVTSYKRRDEVDESMKNITVDQVYDALMASLNQGRTACD